MPSLTKRCRHPRAEWATCGCTWYLRSRVAGRDTYVNVGNDRVRAEQRAAAITSPPRPAGLTDTEVGKLTGQPVVYFMRCGALHKIGATTDLAGRLRTVRSHNPHPVHVVMALPGGYPLERALHRAFHTDRVHGEWFRLPARWLQITTAINAEVAG